MPYPPVCEGGKSLTVMEETEGATARKRVEGKVAIVTGAGQVDGPGIGTGKATSILLARHGARVVLVDREPERAEVTRKEIEQAGGIATVLDGNVTRPSDCERMTQTAVDSRTRGRMAAVMPAGLRQPRARVAG
jgi:NAD(P)-dependent dehydrogenase (short-subunit alcohol dehydrogenase family)